MAYILITTTRGRGLQDYRSVTAKIGSPQDTDGVLAQAVSEVAGELRIVTFWESQAHSDRFAAEKLMPAFRELGMTAAAQENTEFVAFEADDIFLRDAAALP
jgi:hypothetical protein